MKNEHKYRAIFFISIYRNEKLFLLLLNANRVLTKNMKNSC